MSGIGNIGSVTGVHRQTVLRWFSEKAGSCQILPRQQQHESVQVDGFWTYAKRKKQKRWLFYAYVPNELVQPKPAASKG